MIFQLLLRFTRAVVFRIVQGLISLRYRITVKGLETLNPSSLPRSGGILFLPNHPAEIDPVILIMVLGKRFMPHPLVVEHFYELNGFQFFMKLVRALPLPSTDIGVNHWCKKKIARQMEAVVERLQKKENFLIYPAGKLKVSGLEVVGGASFVPDILASCPDANVVLVRTTGLWGSQFSRALTGTSPDFAKTLWNCFKILLKNGIFFTPRREVTVELQAAPENFPRGSDRLQINRFLEFWYNQYPKKGEEPLKLVSFAFWKQELPEVAARHGGKGSGEVEIKPVSQQVLDTVLEEIAKIARRPQAEIERGMHLSQDLGLDSLDLTELYLLLSEKYHVQDIVPGDLLTVEDVVQQAAGHGKERDEDLERHGEAFSWPQEKDRPAPDSKGETIPEVFLRTVDRMGTHAACVDRISSLMHYRRLKMGCLILSEQIRSLPGEKIGVMLPSSTGAYMVVLAVLLSGKIPVMINWTSGVKALDHAMHVGDLKSVISSDRFLSRVETGDMGEIENLFVLLEQIRKKIGWKEKLKGLWLSFKRADVLIHQLKLDKIDPESPAVLLFTSGTEALPKGVPLSHSNLLSNQRAALSCVDLNASDILYGVLPPFHSFGFSMTGLLPILSGIRACYSPDPTDSHGMARDVKKWQPTLFCCAPSFFRSLFHIANSDDLQSLRYVVAGAEKPSEEFFKYVEAHIPNAQALEGYGITECSPVVTLTRPNQPRIGVGQPLPGCDLMVVDGEKHPLAAGQEGEICIRGPNVFSHYLGSSKDPFVVVDGQKWYASGDWGHLDPSGSLVLSGRLKRFVKIGGEMVSLGGLEGEILQLAEKGNWVKGEIEGPPLAVSSQEKQGEKPIIILYTVFPIAAEEVNAALKLSGYGRLVKIAEVRQVDQIPLTGTGKTHYRLLDETWNQSS